MTFKESFDLSSNVLQGHIPKALTNCVNLRHIDLSQNSFEGIILEELGSLKDLTVLKLNENKLTGSIPFQLFRASRLHILMLQANELSGSIPTEVGNLKSARSISMDHNLLKGTIPKEFENIRSLENLHLQTNQLTGIAPTIIRQREHSQSYIADCGDPSFRLNSPLKCPSCTVCCNSDGECINTNSLPVFVWYITITLPLSIPIITILFFSVVSYIQSMKLFLYLPPIQRSTRFNYNDDSVYSFIFSRNLIAQAIYIITMLVQTSFFVIFFQVSNVRLEGSHWLYSIRCPGNKAECEDEKSITPFGWVLFFVVTVLNIGEDLVNGIFQLQKGISFRDKRLFFSGCMLQALAVLALTTSAMYNLAIAETNTDLIMNAVILLFINDLDEKLLSILKRLAPNWTDKTCEDIVEQVRER